MVDFLIECNLRANRPGILNSMMMSTTAKYEQDIKVMADLADQSRLESGFLSTITSLNSPPAVIDERRRHPIDKKDLLNIMLHSKDPKTGETLSDENIRNNVGHAHAGEYIVDRFHIAPHILDSRYVRFHSGIRLCFDTQTDRSHTGHETTSGTVQPP